MKVSGGRDLLACAGEVFTDLIFFGLDRLPRLGKEVKTRNFAISAGGGAAITAAAAALLGRSTQLVTAWGTSILDSDARAGLAASGVSDSWSHVGSGAESGITVAMATRNDRSFLTRPCNEEMLEAHLLRPATLDRLSRAAHLHFALTPSRLRPYREAIGALQAAGTTVSWDLGWNPSLGTSSAFADLGRELDVLFLNDKEACAYAQADSVEDALVHFSTPRNTVVVKLGARGAMARQGGSAQVTARAIRVEALESTGAGDAFNGGFLDAWMQGAPLLDALVAGNICGGQSTRAPGGMGSLPTRAEFRAALEEYTGRQAREGQTG